MSRHPETLAALRAGAAAWRLAGLGELADRLDAWLTRASTDSLEAALGLVATPGQRSPRGAAALAARDDLVRQMAAEFHAGSSAAAAATAISKVLFRYRNTGWRRERTSPTCPAHRLGKAEGVAWRILRTHDAEISAHRVRKILATSSAAHGQRSEV